MTTTDVDAVVAALRDNDRFVVTSHDNPDGDALGSLLAMHLALQSLGKDSVMVLGGPALLPGEYRFLGLEVVEQAVGQQHLAREADVGDTQGPPRLGARPEHGGLPGRR